MAQVVISAAVAGATFVATGGNIPAAAFAFGATSALLGYASAKQRPDGPRIGDAQVTTANYGEPLPYVIATARVAGAVEWQSDKRTSTTESGGKGGSPGGSTTSYTQDVLYGLTSNPKGALLRVWENGKLIWSQIGDTATILASDTTGKWARITFYAGDEDQLPDPTFEAAVGAANAPAYRGRATVFIEGLQLGTSGQLPNLTFEVSQIPPFTTRFNASLIGSVVDEIVPAATIVFSPVNAPAFIPAGVRLLANNNGNYFLFSDQAPQFKLSLTDVSKRGLWVFEVFVNIEFSGAGGTGDPIRFFVAGTGVIQAGYSYKTVSGVVQLHLYADVVNTPYSTVILNYPPPSGKYQMVIDTRGDFASWSVAWVVNDVELRRVVSSAVPQRSFWFGPANGNATGVTAMTFSYCRVRQFTGAANLPATLTESVNALCARAGMAADTYDASALATITKPVRSMVIAQVGATRAPLEQLMASFYFKAAASDKVYFAPIPTAPVVTIDADDIGCGVDSPQAEALPLMFGSELEIPPQVSVRYINTNDDYQSGTETSDRLLRGQKALQTVDLAIGMTPGEAKAVADATLIDAIAGLMTSSVSLDMRYARLEPGDVVQIEREDASLLRFRLGRRSDAQGVLSFELRGDDAGALVSAGITDPGIAAPGTVRLNADTLLLPLDIPLLRDADDQPGWYAAAKPNGEQWPGCQVYSSTNNTAFTSVATIAESAVFGVTTTTLAAFAGVGMDQTSRVSVNMSLGQLSSSTRDAVLADRAVNSLLLGDEVVQFVTATLSSANPNIYALSGFVRGVAGTEWAMSTHTTGERAALLRPAGMRRVTTQQADVGGARFVKAITAGKALDSVTAASFTNTGRSQRPLSPVDLTVKIDPASSLMSFSWSRRSRLSYKLLAPTGIPVGEASELYEVEIIRESTGLVLRSFQTNTPSAVYSGQQQTQDGISSGNVVRFRVYQISATVGRSLSATATSTSTIIPAPQISEFELLGTFAAGVVLTVHIVSSFGTTVVNYTTSAGSPTLAGAATGFAAVIDALPSYVASATGSVVRVTGPNSLPFSLQPQNDLGGFIVLATTQFASPVVGVTVDEQYVMSWESAIGYNASDQHQIRVQRASDNTTIDAIASGLGALNYAEGIASALVGIFNSQTQAQALGMFAAGISGTPKQILLTIPAALQRQYFVRRISNNPGIVSYTVESITTPALAGPARPQVSKATIQGPVTSGYLYLLNINLTDDFIFVAGGADTPTTVATALAALVDAEANFTATSSGAEITVTHITNNVPFTLGQAVLTEPILMGFSTRIQEAT